MLAVEEMPTKLGLKLLDSAGQRGLVTQQRSAARWKLSVSDAAKK
jgi:hypothetical protein